VALSADGNTAVFGGYAANNNPGGAMWSFRRAAGRWTQQGLPFSGTGGTPNGGMQGFGLGLSADGGTLITGSWTDDPVGIASGVGAAWIFAKKFLQIEAPDSAIAGVPVTFNVADIESNSVDTAAHGSVTLTSSDPQAVLPQTFGLLQGRGTFVATFRTPGSQTITGSDTALPLITGTSNTVLVRAAAAQVSPVSLSLVSTAGTSAAIPGSLTVTAESSLSLTVAAADTWLNVSLTSGTTPAVVTVTPVSSNLVPGVYNTTVTLTFGDGRTIIVPVALTVETPLRIAALTNAASFATGPAAPNTLIVAFGNFPGCESGVQVSVDGQATTAWSGSATQINFLVPASVAGRQRSNVQIACGAYTSQPFSLPISVSSPAIFTTTQTGAGQAVIVNQDSTLTPPSPVGSTVTLYGTGFGVLSSSGEDGLRHTLLPVTASIGGEPATVIYAGEAPGFTHGLQQINILLPVDSPKGDALPLRLSVGGLNTQAGVTLAIR
jgi:uncharacterized protein (TIGR03437 family)